MSYPENLYSIRAEATCLGGLIKNPKFLIEIDNFFSEKDFYHKVHKVSYAVLRSIVLNGQNADKVILAQKCKELGLNNFEDLNLFDYLDSISFTNINDKGIKDLAQELIKLRIKRELWDSAAAVQNFIKENGEKSLDELINGVDGIFNTQVARYSTQIEPVDLYGNIEEFIKEIAKNPKDEVGFKTPFPQWNRLFGGLRARNGLINVVSRAGEGKSTFLFNMGKGVCKLNGVKALYIDTEMDLDLNMTRAAAAECQVNAWYMETGNWTKNADLSKKVMSGFERLNKYKGSIYHIYAPNKTIQEIGSIFRRWYYKEVGRGNQCLFIYDYLKITESLEKNKAEYQALGDKVCYLNELGAEFNSPVLSAGQQNRTAQTQGGGRNDDSTTAAASDRINQYAGFNAVFRKKDLEELDEHGTKFGSHLLKPFKTSRVQGKDNYNMNSTVKVIDHAGKTRYKQNFINYDISEYSLEEKGTYADVVRENQFSKPIQKSEKKAINTDI